MEIIRQMQEREDFTERERNIRDYLMEHPEAVISMTAKQLGEVSYSSTAAVNQTTPKQAQSFHFTTYNNADMQYCASFPLWEAGVFALLEQKCRSPPFLP